MNCDAARRLIDAYMDSELDSPNAMAMDEHLANCEGCRRVLESRQSLSAAIKIAATYAPVPDSLRTQIRRETHIRPRLRFGPLSAGLAFAVGVVLVLAVWRPWRSPQERIASDVLAQHQLSLSAPKPLDITSDDSKKVQTWFTGKIGFSPSVPALHAQGFDLMGGRLALIGGHTVPVIVYKCGQHDVEVFVKPSDEYFPIDADRAGLHLRSWNDCGLDYWAVSNDSATELTTLHTEFLKHK